MPSTLCTDGPVLGCDDGVVRIFDIDTGATVGEIDAHASGIKKVAVSPRTGDILSAAYDQRVIVLGRGEPDAARGARGAAGTLGALVQLVAGRNADPCRHVRRHGR